jgi:hypothetical protein
MEIALTAIQTTGGVQEHAFDIADLSVTRTVGRMVLTWSEFITAPPAWRIFPQAGEEVFR